jgi:hypothetical protein
VTPDDWGPQCGWDAGPDPASGCDRVVAEVGDLCPEHAAALAALDAPDDPTILPLDSTHHFTDEFLQSDRTVYAPDVVALLLMVPVESRQNVEAELHRRWRNNGSPNEIRRDIIIENGWYQPGQETT